MWMWLVALGIMAAIVALLATIAFAGPVRKRLGLDRVAPEVQVQAQELKAESPEATPAPPTVVPATMTKVMPATAMPLRTIVVEKQLESPRLLMVQHIFVPTPAHLPQVVSAIENLKPCSGVATVVLVGWCWNEDLWTELQRRAVAPWMEWIREPDNYGLAHSWNHAIKPRAEDFDFVFLAGTHLQFNKARQFQDAVDVLMSMPKAGMVAYNHTYHHLSDQWAPTEVMVDTRVHEVLTPPPPGHGIAGSITCVRMTALREVNFLRSYGVYSPEDAYLALNLVDAGYSVHVLKSSTAYMYADNTPLRQDPDYIAWKRRSLFIGRVDLDADALATLAREVYPVFARYQEEIINE